MSLFARKALDTPEFSRLKHPKFMTIDERLAHWTKQFKTKIIGFVHCPSCGKTILNDNLYIQQHMRLFHVKDRLKNREKRWNFHLTGKHTLGASAFDVASSKEMRNKQYGNVQE